MSDTSGTDPTTPDDLSDDFAKITPPAGPADSDDLDSGDTDGSGLDTGGPSEDAQTDDDGTPVENPSGG